MPLLSQVRRDAISVTTSTFPPIQVRSFEVSRVRASRRKQVLEHHGNRSRLHSKLRGESANRKTRFDSASELVDLEKQGTT